MTSLVFPLCFWTSSDAPLSRVAKTASTCDGSKIVTAMEDGNAVVWKSEVGLDGLLKLNPSVFLVGKGRRVTALTLCKVDIDGPATKENIVLWGTEDGEIVMWDLNDGRALQANIGAFPGTINQLVISTSGRFILCAGLSDCIVILDAASLDCVKVVKNVNGWTSSMGILSTGSQTPDHIFRGTTNGIVDAFLLDEANLELVKTGDLSFDTIDYAPVIGMDISPFSPHLIMAVKRRTCYILQRVQSAIKIVCSIYCNMDGTKSGWTGGSFLSSRTVMLFTEHGCAYTYFIGQPNQVSCNVGTSITTGCTSVLFSDGTNVCSWLNGLNGEDIVAHDGGGSPFCAIASIKPNPKAKKRRIGSVMCILPGTTAETGSPSHLLSFEGGGNGQPVATVWPFWTNLSLEAANHVSRLFPKIVGAPNGDTVSRDGMIKPTNQFEINLGERWTKRTAKDVDLRITAAALISDKLMAVGYENGKIYIVPITTPFFHSLQHIQDHVKTLAANILIKHVGPVTSLFQADFRATGGKNYLLSGGSDQTIQIWDLETCTHLASLVCHARSVKYFATVPLDSGMKLKHGVISVAEDESVTVIDLDSLRRFAGLLFLGIFFETLLKKVYIAYYSNYILTGHKHAVYALHWRSLEETLVVQCSNFEGTIYVWQLKTGHLDRVEEGDTAADIVSCCDCSLILGEYTQDYINANTRQTFSAFPITAGFNRKPTLFVLLVNLKRFINDVYGGQYSLTPPSTPPQARRSDRSIPSPKKEGSSSEQQQQQQLSESPTKTLNVGNLFKGAGGNRSRSPTNTVNSTPGSPQPPSRSPVLSKARSFAPTSDSDSASHGHIVSPKPRNRPLILCAMMSLNLGRPIERLLAVGNRGANGYISVPVPEIGDVAESGGGRGDDPLEWRLSSTMSSSRMLQIVSLLKTLTLKKEYEKDVSTVIAQLCSHPHSISYQLPSFAFLAKYWQDQISDVQQAARVVFSSTLKLLGDEERVKIVDYWRGFLPSLTGSNKKPSKANIRAAVILGIIGCENSDYLPVKLQKETAESLEILLKEDIRSPQKMLAVELLSRGFRSWEPHVNAAAVLRAIILTTGLQSPSTSSGTPSKDGSGGGNSAPNPALVMTSRHAVVQIATINPALFITTITYDFVHSKVVAERVGGLKLLGMFIAKKPTLLYSHIPRILESLVKSLDPNVPGMREAVQMIVTSNFAELVKNFPNVAFHHGSQKLAVGTMEGMTIVYDLKTATKGQVLEGHLKPVTAVAFSPDGKMSVTFSFEENCVRFWQLSSGFLNSLVGAFSGATGGAGSSPGSGHKAGHLKSFREFSVGPKQSVKFEWLGERSVKLHIPRIVSGSPQSGIQVEIDVETDAVGLNALDVVDYKVSYNQTAVGTAILRQKTRSDSEGDIDGTRLLMLSLCPDQEDGEALLAMRNLMSSFGAGSVIDICLTSSNCFDDLGEPITNDISKRQQHIMSIPPFETQIVQEIIAKLPLNPFYMTIAGTITLANPFDCEVCVLHVKGQCIYSTMTIGAVDAVFEGEGVKIPGKGVAETPAITVSLCINMETVYSLMDSISTG
ncbi:hypothetical protein BDR26DRAFT_939723 [Obelidium mucronatum]|nr:hypothetical protein BDR26DRAFT_939723 [Obelidium mucronatum]